MPFTVRVVVPGAECNPELCLLHLSPFLLLQMCITTLCAFRPGIVVYAGYVCFVFVSAVQRSILNSIWPCVYIMTVPRKSPLRMIFLGTVTTNGVFSHPRLSHEDILPGGHTFFRKFQFYWFTKIFFVSLIPIKTPTLSKLLHNLVFITFRM